MDPIVPVYYTRNHDCNMLSFVSSRLRHRQISLATPINDNYVINERLVSNQRRRVSLILCHMELT